MITIAGPGDLAPRRPLFNDAAREQDAELAGYRPTEVLSR